jgi:hypothetical protein
VRVTPKATQTRVVETVGDTLTFALDPRDYSPLDGELYVVITKQVAEDLMHALEGWKDER